jgi:hypothetical protein
MNEIKVHVVDFRSDRNLMLRCRAPAATEDRRPRSGTNYNTTGCGAAAGLNC